MAQLKVIADRIRLFYDPTREPLRRRVYTTLLAIVALAVGAGIITGTVAATLAALAPMVLMVPATEAARRLVTPVAAPLLSSMHSTTNLSPVDLPGKHAQDRS